MLIPLMLLFNLLGFSYLTDIAHAELAPGTYTIKDILAHDSNAHPTTLAELKMYLESKGKVPGRTGWSAYKLVCTEKEDGTGTYWDKTLTVTTDDSGRDKHYAVVDYRDEIVDQFGMDMYEAALASGGTLQYQTGSKTENPIGILNYQWEPCVTENSSTNPGGPDIGGYYNNLDFMLTMTFEVKEKVDGDDGTKPSPPTPPASCTVNINISKTDEMRNTEEHMKSDPHGEILASRSHLNFKK